MIATERRAQREAREQAMSKPVTDRAQEPRLLELRDEAVHRVQQAREWLTKYSRRIARLAQSLFSREALAQLGGQEIAGLDGQAAG